MILLEWICHCLLECGSMKTPLYFSRLGHLAFQMTLLVQRAFSTHRSFAGVLAPTSTLCCNSLLAVSQRVCASFEIISCSAIPVLGGYIA